MNDNSFLPLPNTFSCKHPHRISDPRFTNSGNLFEQIVRQHQTDRVAFSQEGLSQSQSCLRSEVVSEDHTLLQLGEGPERRASGNGDCSVSDDKPEVHDSSSVEWSAKEPLIECVDSDVSVTSDFEKLNNICLMGSEEMEKLRQKLKANHIFMSMVIHDMRSPTVSARLSLESSLQTLEGVSKKVQTASRIERELHSTLDLWWRQLASIRYSLEKTQRYHSSLQSQETERQGFRASNPRHIRTEPGIESFSQEGALQVRQKELTFSPLPSVRPRASQTEAQILKVLCQVEGVLVENDLKLPEELRSSLEDILRKCVARNDQSAERLMTFQPCMRLDLEEDLSSVPDELEKSPVQHENPTDQLDLALAQLSSLQEQLHQLKKWRSSEQLKEAGSELEKSKSLLKSQLVSESLMEVLINDLMDHAKMENQKFAFTNEIFDLASTIKDAFSILEHTARERRVSLEARIGSEAQLKYIRNIQGDKRRYMQVLLNFISNSLKFTNENGHVSVAITLVSDQEVQDMDMLSQFSEDGSEQFCGDEPLALHHNSREFYVSFHLEVIDTGIGISEEGINNLFFDFGKLNENAHRNKSGTGLGLSICKKIIEQMGGQVKVESTLGLGTTFRITLNSKCSLPKGMESSPSTLAAFESEESFVFLKKQPDDLQICQFFFDSNLPNNLDEKKTKILPDSNESQSGSLSSTEFDPAAHMALQSWDQQQQDIKCLLANDEVLQLQILQTVLKRQGFRVTPALNGHEAFEKARTARCQAVTQQFEVVILDLNMPICDGFQACFQISQMFRGSRGQCEEKAEPSKQKSTLAFEDEDRKPLLVALTSFVDSHVEQRAAEAGFDLTLQSPLTVDTIERKLRPQIMRRREAIQSKLKMHQYYDRKVNKLKVQKQGSSNKAEFFKLLDPRLRSSSSKSRVTKQAFVVEKPFGDRLGNERLSSQELTLPKHSSLVVHSSQKRPRERALLEDLNDLPELRSLSYSD